MLPVMARMAEVIPEYQFVVAATPVQPGELYDRLLASRPIKRDDGAYLRSPFGGACGVGYFGDG